MTHEQLVRYETWRRRFGMPKHGTLIWIPPLRPVSLLVRRIVIHLSTGGQW